jgi:hypothetical protein
MAIDIKKFLETIKKEPEQKKEISDVSKPFELDFEKDVTNTLKELTSSLDSKSLKELHSLYLEIKKFDEHLPHKFLSIEKETGSSFSNISKTYSLKVISVLEQRKNILMSQFNQELQNFDSYLSQKEYSHLPNSLEKLYDLLHKFPKELRSDYVIMEKELLLREQEIKKAVSTFEQTELQEYRRTFLSLLSLVLSSLKKKDVELVEQSSEQVKDFYKSIPLLFKPLFSKEHSHMLQLFVSVQQFLLEEEKKLHEFKEKEFHQLLERYQHSVLRKDVSNAVLIYNELVVLFNSMPLSNLEKKKEYLEKLGKIHTQLQELYVRTNVDMFLHSYSTSKILEEAREYLGHVAFTKKATLENVELILKKLEDLPEDLKRTSECKNFLRAYSSLYETLRNSKLNKKNQKVEKPFENKDFTVKIQPSTKNVSKDVFKEFDDSSFENKDNEVSKEDLEISKVQEQPKRFQKNSENLTSSKEDDKENKQDVTGKKKTLFPKHSKIDSNIAKEIEKLYQELQEKKTKDEARVLYKKIFFYLDFLHIPKEKKDELRLKVENKYMGLK